MSSLTPVLVIGYSRPDLLRASLEKLSGVGRDVYIAIDGPKGDLDAKLVYESREISRNFAVENADMQETFLLLRETNLGCKLGVSTAIDWIFDNVDEAIILEDDIYFNEEFLTTMDHWLTKFRNRNDIFHLNGFNPLPRKFESTEAYLSRYTHVWGWATWKNRWNYYDRNLENWDESNFRTLPGLIGQDLSNEFFEYWRMQLSECVNGLDTWDIQWLFSQWLYGGYALTPGSRLTGNCGFDIRATHTASSGNRNRERLPEFHNYKFIDCNAPHLNLELNRIHDLVEYGIDARNEHLNSCIWRVRIATARLYLQIISFSRVSQFYNVLRLKLLPTELFYRNIFLFVSRLTSGLWKTVMHVLHYKLLYNVVRTINLFKRGCKYIYWRFLRQLWRL